VAVPRMLMRCPNCLAEDFDRFECCGQPLTVPSLAPLLPDVTWGHVVVGRAHCREVSALLLDRVCAGHSPLAARDAAGLFAVCRAAPGHLAWLWQSDLDTLLGGGFEGNRAQYAFSKSHGLIVELASLPRGGVGELEESFERLIGLVEQTKSRSEPPLGLIAVVADDLLRDGRGRFRLETYCASLAKEFHVVRDVKSALRFLISRGPPAQRSGWRPAVSPDVRVLDLDGSLGSELLGQLHTRTAMNRALGHFTANENDVAGARWRRLTRARPLPGAAGTYIPPWRGLRRFGLMRSQPVTVERATDFGFLLDDVPSPLVVCIGQLSAKSEHLLHCLLVRLARFQLSPTVVVRSNDSSNELVTWCQERFPGAKWIAWGEAAPLAVLEAALRDVPLPPLLEGSDPASWFARLWPFGRRSVAA